MGVDNKSSLCPDTVSSTHGSCDSFAQLVTKRDMRPPTGRWTSDSGIDISILIPKCPKESPGRDFNMFRASAAGVDSVEGCDLGEALVRGIAVSGRTLGVEAGDLHD